MNYVQPIKTKAKIDEIENILKDWNEKYRIMYLVGIYTGLRISDILALQVKDIYGKDHVDIREKKTRKAKRFKINRILAKEISKFCSGRAEDEFLIQSRQGQNQAIVSRRAYEVIKKAGQLAGVDNLGTHSMRKTFGYHYYKQTGDIVTLQKIFNHAAPAVTMLYIGIVQDSIDNAVYNFEFKSNI